jgi:hypothetical protein
VPYIRQDQRRRFYAGGAVLVTDFGFICDTAGELNYVLTSVVLGYLAKKGLSYGTINDIVGALEGAKLEFVRRVSAPYEDKKIQQNGDVYPEELEGS